MTQPEETTAALIARLHEQLTESNQARDHWEGAHDRMKRAYHESQKERDASFAATSKAQDERDQARVDLEASKAECLQWRKDIDEERRQVAFRDSMIATMTKQMDESDRDRVRVCNEQRARAEKAEWALEAEVERCIAEKRQGDIYWNEIHEARKKLGETKPEREGGRSLALCVLDIKGLVDALDQDNRELRQRAESAEHKVAMLEAEVASLRQSRDEADETLIRERKHLQELAERCPRKLHCRSIDIIRDRLETFAEQEAGRNKEAAKLRKELEEAREQLAVMTKQRDSLQWHNDHNYMRGKEAMLRLDGAQSELMACREQLAKLEWKGRLTDAGPLICHACLLCEGADPSDTGSRRLPDAARGHRPTCWFALERNRKIAETVDPPRKPGKIRNHRQDCPARTAEDVAWVDSQWQVNGCQAAPIEGPRPKPIGCAGCKCKKPQTWREQWKTKQAHYDHWADAFSYILLGVDWAGGNSVTVKTGRPVRPGASFAYNQSSGIWKLVDNHPAKEPARPEPRFKVGEKVYGSGSVHEVAFTEWHSSTSEPPGWWMYTTATKWLFRENELKPAPKFKVGQRVITPADYIFEVKDISWAGGWVYGDSDKNRFSEVLPLRPAPKFAVGEWVMWRNQAGDVGMRDYGVNGWTYEVTTIGSVHESQLTAQTPQHKHDCRGCVCVFLGRYSNRRGGEWDLWYRDAPGRELGFDCGYGLQWWSVNARGGAMDQTIAEARRRAVARGLV